MRSVAGIGKHQAQRVEEDRMPVTETTRQILDFLEQTQPGVGLDSVHKRTQRATKRNAERPEPERWPPAEIRRAARFTQTQAPAIVTPRPQAIATPMPPAEASATMRVVEEIRAQVPSIGLDPEAFYEAILTANEARSIPQRWPDNRMRSAADVTRYQARRIVEQRRPLTPRTEAARDFLLTTAPAGPTTIRDRYERAAAENQTRAAADQWPRESMQRAARLTRPARASARSDEDTAAQLQAITTFMDESRPSGQEDTGADRYRRAVRHDLAQGPGERWINSLMVRAAGITRPSAANIRRQEQPAAAPRPVLRDLRPAPSGR